jgi:hypothetical protein
MTRKLILERMDYARLSNRQMMRHRVDAVKGGSRPSQLFRRKMTSVWKILVIFD